MSENPFELLEPAPGAPDEISVEDMHAVMDEVRSVVREGEARGRKSEKLQSALSLFNTALEKELERISGPGSRESDFIALLPSYRDKILAQASEGLRIHLTSFFRENGIHFDRSVFTAGALDERGEYMRSLYIQAFIISILNYQHLIGADTAHDELAALKLATRYGEQFVKDYFHGSYILDTLNKKAQTEEERWSEAEVADIFQEGIRKHIAVSNIASVESALSRIAENVRFLRDSARVASAINASLKPGDELWSAAEVAGIFQENIRKHIAVDAIASVESVLQNLGIFFQNNVYIQLRLSAKNRAMIERKLNIRLA